ncbi:MAG: hypothetical protein AABX61_02680, partial [Nanoarchaeota archaeon]
MNRDLIENAIQDYKNGNSLRQLNSKYNINISLLYYHLNKAGIIRKHNIVKSIKNNNEILIGILIGIWSGDGSKFIDRHAYTIKIHLNKNDIEL